MKQIDDYIKLLVDEPQKKNMELIDTYDARLIRFQDERPTELPKFKDHLTKLGRFRQALSSLKFNLTLETVQAIIVDDMGKEQEQWLQDQENAIAAIDDEISSLKTTIEIQNKSNNEHIRQQYKDSNAGYDSLEQKRKILEGYSDKIFDMCSAYGITSSDINIDENMFTVAELDKLYDDYIKYMQKEERGTNAIAKFRSTVNDAYIQGVILLILLIVCFTPVLNILSILFFGLLAANQISNVNRSKYYSILMAITFNVKPENLGYNEFDGSGLLPEELTDEMLDTDERFAGFEQRYQDIFDKFEEINPEKQNAKIMSEWASKMPANKAKLDEYRKIYENKVRRISSDVDAEIAYCQKIYKKLMDEYKFIGERFSNHLVLNGTYALGIHDDCIEETVEIGERNIILRPNHDTTLMNKFLQALVVNAISNVFPGKLKILVYDPNNFGRSLMPLFRNELNEYMEFYNDDLGKVIDELVDYVQNNFKEMSGKTIQEFNQHCEDVGMTPIDYRILIVLSQPKTIEEDEKLTHFFEYSATGGVYIWMVSDSMQSKGAFVFRTPFEGVANPISNRINDGWCNKVAANYTDAIANAKPAGLPWKDFIDIAIPKEKEWTGNADDTMNLYPGFLNGDPTSYKPFTIGNQGNVHVIGVGGTGAGKSVFLNHLVATIGREYSPTEVELWLCDFKGTEFKFYMASEQYPFMLPHIKACLCTSDGDFATSLFHALRQEADHRYDVLKNPNDFTSELAYFGDGKPIPNQKGTVGWNRYWRKKASDTGDPGYIKNCWPRILFICDEFQVIFEKADAKNLDSIKADITQIAKVGRAANVHIFFTSQSMKKTLSADILQQFTLRFALRCDREVSQEILGTSKASDIKEKFGFLYVKATGIANEDQPRYRTPFIADDVLREHIKELYDKANAMNIPKKNVITYEEVTKHPIAEMYQTYELMKKENKLPKSGLFLLGNRMAYSANKAPDNIILGAKNNTNIMACLSDYNDYVLFFNELMGNIKSNQVPGTVIINSQVADLAYICCAEDYITYPDKHGRLLSEKVSCVEFMKWSMQLVDAWKKQNKKDSPVWIFLLGWDKGKGFAIEPDSTQRTKFIATMQTAGEFNIHFIFLNTSMTGINFASVGACKHRIAAKCSVDDSQALIGTKQASVLYDIPTGWIFSWNDGKITRDKLYISEVKREIESSEIVL